MMSVDNRALTTWCWSKMEAVTPPHWGCSIKQSLRANSSLQVHQIYYKMQLSYASAILSTA